MTGTVHPQCRLGEIPPYPAQDTDSFAGEMPIPSRVNPSFPFSSLRRGARRSIAERSLRDRNTRVESSVAIPRLDAEVPSAKPVEPPTASKVDSASLVASGDADEDDSATAGSSVASSGVLLPPSSGELAGSSWGPPARATRIVADLSPGDGGADRRALACYSPRPKRERAVAAHGAEPSVRSPEAEERDGRQLIHRVQPTEGEQRENWNWKSHRSSAFGL